MLLVLVEATYSVALCEWLIMYSRVLTVCFYARFVSLVLLFNFVMHCMISAIIVAFEIDSYLSIYLTKYLFVG